MSHATAPALDTDDVVALVDEAELESMRNTPLEAAVNILLPDLDIEVGLLLREGEGPNTTIQMGVLDCTVSDAHLSNDDDEIKLTRAAMGLRVTMMIGQTGRYLERRRAVLPLRIYC